MVDNKFDTPIYKRARFGHCMQCMFDYVISLLAADAFLAKLLNYIGMSDSLVGIVSSIATLSFLFQLFSIFAVKKMKNIKTNVVVCYTLCELLFLGVYMIPFMSISTALKSGLVVISLVLAYFLKALVSGIAFKWANMFVDPEKRASFSAVKEIVSLAAVVVFTFTAGVMIDKYAEIGELEKGFLFVSIGILIFTVFNFLSLIIIKNKKIDEEDESESFIDIVKNVFGNNKFRSVIYLTAFYNIARYTSLGFLGIYKTKDLAMTVTAIQVINTVGIILRIFVSKPFGVYSDKKSFAEGFRLACILEGAACLIMAFTIPKTWWLYIAYSAVFNISCAGSEMNAYNIVYNYIDKKYFVAALAIKNSIGGVCGLLISIVAGKLLSVVQADGNTVFGIQIYGQQLLSFVSFVMFMLTAFYIKKVFSKYELMKQ
ncbi:MAG: MFS transporter [Clostridia bacterium]|nr:MFS transporter [Clostridia bacterium]